MSFSTRILLRAFGVLLCFACSSSDDQSETRETTTESIVFEMRYELPPVSEVYRCQYVRVPAVGDGDDVFVTGFEYPPGIGTHHVGIFKSYLEDIPADTPEGEPFDCYENASALQHTGQIIVGGLNASAKYEFPEGVALALEAGQVLLLQVHALNGSDAPKPAELVATFKTAPGDEVRHRVGFLQFYNNYIHVPPRATADAQMRCRTPRDMTLLTGETHFHVHGVREDVFVDLAGGPPATEPLVQGYSWEHPGDWSGELDVPADSSFRVVCNYRNGDAEPVVQGQRKFEDEMCMFGGYYYPASDDPIFEACQGEYGSGFSAGTGTCSDVLACVQACPPEPPTINALQLKLPVCWQECVASSCSSGSSRFHRQFFCLLTQCSTECAADGEPCNACLADRCGAELEACFSDDCSTPE